MILHGENTVASRWELDRLRSEFSGEVVELEGKNLTATDFIQATESQSLFGSARLVIVENYLAGKKSLEVPLSDLSAEVVFWEEKELSKTLLEKILQEQPKTAVRIFKIEPVIFKLTDSLLAGKGKQAVLLFRECLKNEEPEYIFIMIIRQFRLMQFYDNLPTWQKEKVSRQAKTFGPEKLSAIYRRLLEIDYKHKTSQLPGSLAGELEIFLLWI